ncbi:hypothetical protein HED60_21775 [Planctomycetales bacterium ZRK34]|nr:hypothetical protein HED60_21775 [Planctomycetales bacterium ZRK34]
MSDAVDIFLQQAAAYLDGDLPAEAHEALHAELLADPEKRRRFVDLCLHSAVLTETFSHPLSHPASPMLSEAKRRGIDSAPRSTYTLSRIVALAALIALAVTAWFVFSPESQTATHTPSTPVAMLSDHSADAVFVGADGSMELGSELARGSLSLISGTAQVMFRSGAVVDLTGPCSLEMIDDNRGFLHTGTLSAYVPDQAHGFTVNAPHGVRVVDLGTRFLMTVDPSGGTQLIVLEGAVHYEGIQPAGKLTAGSSATIIDGSAQVYHPQPGQTLALPPHIRNPLLHDDFETAPSGFTFRGNVNRMTQAQRAWQGHAYVGFNIGNSDVNGVAEQTLATLPGMTYQLQFELGKYLLGEGAARLDVDVLTESGDTTLLHETASVVEGSDTMPVTPTTFTYRFTARGLTTRLRLTDTSTNHASAFDLYLDNIRIVPVLPTAELTPSGNLKN